MIFHPILKHLQIPRVSDLPITAGYRHQHGASRALMPAIGARRFATNSLERAMQSILRFYRDFLPVGFQMLDAFPDLPEERVPGIGNAAIEPVTECVANTENEGLADLGIMIL